MPEPHKYSHHTRQHKKRAERSIARYGRKKHEAILDCPFRGVGAIVVFPPPGLEDGAVVAETGGIGGSTTSLSFRTGYGASAGGRYPAVMTCMRLPASTGATVDSSLMVKSTENHPLIGTPLTRRSGAQIPIPSFVN
ncbi:hypothetical protein CFP56_033454 [Quercus suber]|uniref:Uncharacterized protein n=1 Tax=Quercus suber TaxID=58331 RepID=A0AAW0LUQ7_QUESU